MMSERLCRHARPRTDDPANSSHVASASPAIVDIDASMATSSPRARAAAVVIGPIVTAGARARRVGAHRIDERVHRRRRRERHEIDLAGQQPLAQRGRAFAVGRPSEYSGDAIDDRTELPRVPSCSVSRAPSAAAYSTRAPRTSRRSRSASSSAFGDEPIGRDVDGEPALEQRDRRRGPDRARA